MIAHRVRPTIFAALATHINYQVIHAVVTFLLLENRLNNLARAGAQDRQEGVAQL